MSATYKDIRRLTGFSLSTISKYFNGGNVMPETKMAIEEVASQLNFRVNDFARGLKSGRSMAVGILIPRLNSFFSTTIMRYVGHFLRLNGYSCIVCESDASRNTERDALNFLIDKMVDGIITIPFDPSGVHLESARERGIPVVLVDRIALSFESDVVLLNNYAAGKMAAEHLLTKGHTKAAIIYGPEYVYTMSQRKKGFVDAYLRHGSGACAHVIEAFFSIEDAYKAAKDLLTSNNDISAIFCPNYELTIGTYAAINELGLRSPEDISFIGFDNMELSRILKPTVTLIEQPMERLAHVAANLLLKRLESDREYGHETIMLKAKLVEGDSVADLN